MKYLIFKKAIFIKGFMVISGKIIIGEFLIKILKKRNFYYGKKNIYKKSKK